MIRARNNLLYTLSDWNLNTREIDREHRPPLQSQETAAALSVDCPTPSRLTSLIITLGFGVFLSRAYFGVVPPLFPPVLTASLSACMVGNTFLPM